MRHIGLNNFINKVISRVVHNRLDRLLPAVISSNQSGFVKGRNIIENVLLTQEIVTDIRKRGKPANFVIKLDITKAYDRASWLYLCKSDFIGRGMPKWSSALNHLAYADDTIIFSSAESNSLQVIMDTLQEYERISGQLINKRKSSFYMFNKVSNQLIQQVEIVTGFVRGQFPFTYLGCPITHVRKRKFDYTDILKKFKDKLQTWKGKMLSYGGKAVLITSVLQSIRINILSAIMPSKCVIKELHKIFAKIFWNNKKEGRSRH
ncbi:uncharacterized protein LOC132643959 [Lycium barbarum]|uniref:uncharacterized protein LOC132643959 n=1 Tax=Lycium barbarum TaxID=112863 RepID=UPI00293EA28B|nr:uncharacterized protein LOC132643959 [Lycium barbarum]